MNFPDDGVSKLDLVGSDLAVLYSRIANGLVSTEWFPDVDITPLSISCHCGLATTKQSQIKLMIGDSGYPIFYDSHLNNTGVTAYYSTYSNLPKVRIPKFTKIAWILSNDSLDAYIGFMFKYYNETIETPIIQEQKSCDICDSIFGGLI